MGTYPEKIYARTCRQGTYVPRGFRARFRAALRRMAIDVLAFRPPASSAKFLRCLYCHYVFDDQRERFERMIVALKRMGTFVTTDRCSEIVAGRAPIDGPLFHLSFDDGFRNVFTNAFPILQKHGVSCAFFVPSAYVGADWEQARQYCTQTSDCYRGVIELVNWAELRVMSAAGHDIGSHTRSHVRLSDPALSGVRLQEEIAGSKAEIEAQLGRSCAYISWPYGRDQDITPDSLGMIRGTGYRACFSAIRGSVTTAQLPDPIRIPRHHFEPQWPLRHVRYFAGRGTGGGR